MLELYFNLKKRILLELCGVYFQVNKGAKVLIPKEKSGKFEHWLYKSNLYKHYLKTTKLTSTSIWTKKLKRRGIYSVMTAFTTSAHFTTPQVSACKVKIKCWTDWSFVLQLQNWRADLQSLGLSTSGNSTDWALRYSHSETRMWEEVEQDRIRRNEGDWKPVWNVGDV